jgi:hypothetical protein
MDLAPIGFFAYKRPEHTLKALTSLAQCELAQESRLYIFCDGPKTPADREAVLQVQEAVSRERWCGTVEIIRREQNLGLSRSIIAGTAELCRQYGRVIVIEDDLLLAPQFLQYMNAALEGYQAEEQVMQVSGYMFPVDLGADTDAVFLPFTTTWGWATWERAWRHFDPDISGYAELKKSRKLRNKFDLERAYPYFAMLELQRQGRIDSWGIRWYLSTFLRGGLTLYPVQTLVQNSGFDGSGTHCGPSQSFNHLSFSDYKLDSYPEIWVNNLHFDKMKYYLKCQKTPFIRKCLIKLVKMVRNK